MTKKKLKYVIITAICISALIILPFVVAWSYKLGESIIIINLPFSKGEILSYIAAAMGVSISIIALFVATNAGNPDIEIKRTAYRIVGEEMQIDKKYQEGLSISNKSPVEVSIAQIGLISKKRIKKNKNRLTAIIMWNGTINYPIKIQPYDSVDVCCDSNILHNDIYYFGKAMEENDCKSNEVIFYVKLSCGEIFELKSKYDYVYFERDSKGAVENGENENADK